MRLVDFLRTVGFLRAVAFLRAVVFLALVFLRLPELDPLDRDAELLAPDDLAVDLRVEFPPPLDFGFDLPFEPPID